MMNLPGDKKSLPTTILLSLAIFSAIFAIALFGHLKSVENKFKKEKTVLVKEKMELRNEFDALRADMKAREDALAIVESEKKAMADEVDQLKRQVEDLRSRGVQEAELLRKENLSLKEEMGIVKQVSISQMIRDAMIGEANETVRKVLQDTLSKIEMIKAGKPVMLEPIVMTGGSAGMSAGAEAASSSLGGKSGRVLSIDAKDNLVVIDMGRASDVREGQRISILKDGQKIASAEIIRTRYKISAGFVDSVEPKFTVKDIREGSQIAIE